MWLDLPVRQLENHCKRGSAQFLHGYCTRILQHPHPLAPPHTPPPTGPPGLQKNTLNNCCVAIPPHGYIDSSHSTQIPWVRSGQPSEGHCIVRLNLLSATVRGFKRRLSIRKILPRQLRSFSCSAEDARRVSAALGAAAISHSSQLPIGSRFKMQCKS